MPESYFLLVWMETDGFYGLVVKSIGLESQTAWIHILAPPRSQNIFSVKVSSTGSDD